MKNLSTEIIENVIYRRIDGVDLSTSWAIWIKSLNGLFYNMFSTANPVYIR